MVYVSDKPLKKEVLARISELLITNVANIRTKSHSEQFLEEILTPSEKIMLAKRFAIVAMLYRKQSYTKIMKMLKVSHTTVAKINLELKSGEFNFIISQLQKTGGDSNKKNESNFSIWLDIVLGMRMPPRGKNRWKFLNEIENKKRYK